MPTVCNTFWGSHGCDLFTDHATPDYPWHVCMNEETHRPCSRVVEIKQVAEHLAPGDPRVEMPEGRFGVTDTGYLVVLFEVDTDRNEVINGLVSGENGSMGQGS